MLLLELCVQKMGFSHALLALFLLLSHHFLFIQMPSNVFNRMGKRAETESRKHLEPHLSTCNHIKKTTFLSIVAVNNGQLVQSCACEMNGRKSYTRFLVANYSREMALRRSCDTLKLS